MGVVLCLPLLTCCKSHKIEDPIIDPPPPDPGMKIVSLHYSKHGMRGNVEKRYEMEWEESEMRYKLTYEDYNGTKTTYSDFSLGVEIGVYLREGNVDKYKDYYDPGPNVLDGWTWRFEVKYANGSSIRSGGRIKKPKDFSGVERTLKRLDSEMGIGER